MAIRLSGKCAHTAAIAPTLLAQASYMDPNGEYTLYDEMAIVNTDTGMRWLSPEGIDGSVYADNPNVKLYLDPQMESDKDNTGGYKFYPETSGLLSLHLELRVAAETTDPGGGWKMELAASWDMANNSYSGPWGYKGVTEVADHTFHRATAVIPYEREAWLEQDPTGQLGFMASHAVPWNQSGINWGIAAWAWTAVWSPVNDTPAPTPIA